MKIVICLFFLALSHLVVFAQTDPHLLFPESEEEIQQWLDLADIDQIDIFFLDLSNFRSIWAKTGPISITESLKPMNSCSVPLFSVQELLLNLLLRQHTCHFHQSPSSDEETWMKMNS